MSKFEIKMEPSNMHNSSELMMYHNDRPVACLERWLPTMYQRGTLLELIRIAYELGQKSAVSSARLKS